MWIISYWILPVIAAVSWAGMLVAMLVYWSLLPDRHLPDMSADQNIAYISDIGAFTLKPLFIACGAVTVVFLDLGILAERWLRHNGRLVSNTTHQKILSFFAIFFAIAGAAGLIVLTIFDTYHHKNVHDVCLLIFIVGYVLSAVFLCAEYQRLGIHYRHHRVLAVSFWIKLTFIFVEVVLAICFAATSFTHHYNVAAVFEWIVAFVYTFYVLSFVVDLWPSIRTKSHIPQGHKEQMLENGQLHLNQHGRFSQQSTRHASFEQNLTTDSAGPNQPGNKVRYDEPPRSQKHGVRRYF